MPPSPVAATRSRVGCEYAFRGRSTVTVVDRLDHWTLQVSDADVTRQDL